jgi:hypothetical protein
LPAWVAAAIYCHAGERKLGWLMLVLLAAGAGAASLMLGALADAGFWRIRAGSAVVEFLWYVHTGHEPTAYTGVYADLSRMDEPGFLLIAGIALAFAAALGAFVLALPVAVIAARDRRALQPIDAACGYLVACWLLLMLFAPTPWHGDPSDLIHRPFVLLYGACAIWTLCLGLRIVGKPPWLLFAAVSLLALPFVFATAGRMAQPKFRWSEFDAAVRVPPGLVEAAQFMRSHSASGDTFAVAGLKLAYATFDLSTQLCALSGVPAYLSRPHFETIKDLPRKELALRRLAALQEIDDSTQYDAAMQALRALGVRWYFAAGGEGPRWDPARGRAAFKSGTVALYRTP